MSIVTVTVTYFIPTYEMKEVVVNHLKRVGRLHGQTTSTVTEMLAPYQHPLFDQGFKPSLVHEVCAIGVCHTEAAELRKFYDSPSLKSAGYSEELKTLIMLFHN